MRRLLRPWRAVRSAAVLAVRSRSPASSLRGGAVARSAAGGRRWWRCRWFEGECTCAGVLTASLKKGWGLWERRPRTLVRHLPCRRCLRPSCHTFYHTPAEGARTCSCTCCVLRGSLGWCVAIAGRYPAWEFRGGCTLSAVSTCAIKRIGGPLHSHGSRGAAGEGSCEPRSLHFHCRRKGCEQDDVAHTRGPCRGCDHQLRGAWTRHLSEEPWWVGEWGSVLAGGKQKLPAQRQMRG